MNKLERACLTSIRRRFLTDIEELANARIQRFLTEFQRDLYDHTVRVTFGNGTATGSIDGLSEPPPRCRPMLRAAWSHLAGMLHDVWEITEGYTLVSPEDISYPPEDTKKG